MSTKVERNFLAINSVKDLNEPKSHNKEISISLLEPVDFQINKFFYKNIGKEHNWVDRLVWTDKQWINYVSDEKVKTYILKYKDDLAGYFELILNKEINEVEIAYLGLLKEYHNRKFGSHLLSAAIKNSFLEKPNRVWAHTCSLDHKNALYNYLSRGMKIFKNETILI